MSMMVDLSLNVKATAAKDYSDRETMLESQRELMVTVNKSKRTNHIFSGVLAGITMITNIVLCWPHLMTNAK